MESRETGPRGQGLEPLDLYLNDVISGPLIAGSYCIYRAPILGSGKQQEKTKNTCLLRSMVLEKREKKVNK